MNYLLLIENEVINFKKDQEKEGHLKMYKAS